LGRPLSSLFSSKERPLSLLFSWEGPSPLSSLLYERKAPLLSFLPSLFSSLKKAPLLSLLF